MRKYRLSNEPKAEIVLCRSRVHSRMSLSDMASAGLLRCGRYPLLRACREDEPALRLQLARSCQPDASLPRFGYVRDERVLSHLPRTRMCETGCGSICCQSRCRPPCRHSNPTPFWRG